MKDLSIIVPTSRPNTLAHVLGYINNQSIDGIEYEVIVVQEADDFEQFKLLRYGPRFSIFRQKPHADCGAAAKDRGILESSGQYVIFWDDDNIYYPHAAASLFSAALGHDIGIVRTRHQGMIIPSGPLLQAGDIDSMCFCVKKELAAKIQWADRGGRYSDYRWISRIMALTDKVNRSPIIIGEHL
jgi:glycosyltransferase involved in cell wall biosynthesis